MGLMLLCLDKRGRRLSLGPRLLPLGMHILFIYIILYYIILYYIILYFILFYFILFYFDMSNETLEPIAGFPCFSYHTGYFASIFYPMIFSFCILAKLLT